MYKTNAPCLESENIYIISNEFDKLYLEQIRWIMLAPQVVCSAHKKRFRCRLRLVLSNSRDNMFACLVIIFLFVSTTKKVVKHCDCWEHFSSYFDLFSQILASFLVSITWIWVCALVNKYKSNVIRVSPSFLCPVYCNSLILFKNSTFLWSIKQTLPKFRNKPKTISLYRT